MSPIFKDVLVHDTAVSAAKANHSSLQKHSKHQLHCEKA
jgi:hypothetical protein